MKSRIIVAATAVATGLAILPATPVFAEDENIGVTAQTGTMAERSNPRLVGFPEVLEGYVDASWGGLAEGAAISSVSIINEFGEVSHSSKLNGLYVNVSDLNRPFLGPSSAATEDGIVRAEHEFVIVYADGSIDRTTQQFEVQPSRMKDAYSAYLENTQFEIGKTDTRELKSLPSGSRVTLLNAPDGWDVQLVEPRSLKITATTQIYLGSIDLAVIYPDGSSETVNVRVESVPAPFQPYPQPEVDPDPRPVRERPEDRETTTVTSTVTQPASTERVTSTVPTTVVSTVNGTPVTVTSERTVISEVPVTEKTVIVETPEPSSSQRALPIVTVILALVGAIGGVLATLLNLPVVRDRLG